MRLLPFTIIMLVLGLIAMLTALGLLGVLARAVAP